MLATRMSCVGQYGRQCETWICDSNYSGSELMRIPAGNPSAECGDRSICRTAMHRRSFLFCSVYYAAIFTFCWLQKISSVPFHRDILSASLLIKSHFQEKFINFFHFSFVNYTAHRNERIQQKKSRKRKEREKKPKIMI